MQCDPYFIGALIWLALVGVGLFAVITLIKELD